jgi:hypothetical protein
VIRLSVSCSGRALLPQTSSGTHFWQRLSKSHGQFTAGRIKYIEKKSLTSSGLEPVTFRLVAWRLNQLFYIYIYYIIYYKILSVWSADSAFVSRRYVRWTLVWCVVQYMGVGTASAVQLKYLRSAFATKANEGDGNWGESVAGNLVMCTLHQVLLGRLNWGVRNERRM